MAVTVTIYSEKDLSIRGRSIYWGDPDDCNVTSYLGADNSELPLHLEYDFCSPPAPARHRILLRFDLSSLPDGIQVTSAKLQIYNYRNDSGGATMVFNVYKADAKAWTGDSTTTFFEYSAGNAWAEKGMKPNDDYTDRVLDSFTATTTTDPTFVELDVTEAVQEGVEKDTPKVELMLMRNDGDSSVGGGLENYIYIRSSTYTDAQQRPKLVVTYRKPLTFYEADESGNIDLTKEVFIEDAGKSRVGTVIQTGDGSWDDPTIGSQRKYFVKNERTDASLAKVYVFSSDDRADLPQADSGNTGDGTMSEVTTDPDKTAKEEWYVEMTSNGPNATFNVYRRTMYSTGSWTLDGSGTTGSTYTSSARGISFTITDGATNFVTGDKFTFRTWPDNSISGAPSDSDDLLQICKDSSGSPDGNWQYIKPPMTKLNGTPTSSTVTVDSAMYFTPNMKVAIFDVSEGEWRYGTSGNGITVVSVPNSTTLVLAEDPSSWSPPAADNDWVWGIPINWSSLGPGSSEAFWLRGVCFSTTTKEMKRQHLDAEEIPEGWPFVLD